MAAKKTAKPKGEPSVQELQAEVERLQAELEATRRQRDAAEEAARVATDRRSAQESAYSAALRDEVRQRVEAEGRAEAWSVQYHADFERAPAQAALARAEKAELERDNAFSESAKLREAAARLEVQLANTRDEARTEREAKVALQARLDGLLRPLAEPTNPGTPPQA